MQPYVDDSRVLRLPYRGAPQTVGVMARAALDSQNHIAVRRFSELCCRGIASKDYLSEYLALYYAVLQKCRYMRDPRTVELVRAPHIVAEEILDGGTPSLDCDDMGCFLVSCTLAVGGGARFCTVAFQDMFYQGERQYSHVFGEAQNPYGGGWVVLDPVAAEKTPQMLARVKASKTWPVR